MQVFIYCKITTCFRCSSHPSSGVHKTVTAASNVAKYAHTGGMLLLRYCDIWPHWRNVVAQILWHLATLEECCCSDTVTFGHTGGMLLLRYCDIWPRWRNVVAQILTFGHTGGRLLLRYWHLATLEEGCCSDTVTCTRGCSYSFMYSWWWTRWTPETYRVILQ
jgi:hypothetical protein